MKHTPILAALAALVLPTACPSTEPPQMPTESHPVTLVLVDDAGWDLWEAAHTPNLDRLAEGGIVFENAWMAPRCAAARALIYSGLESHRPENLVGWGLPPGNDFELPITGSLLPQVLPGTKSHRGKFHLGPRERAPDWPIEAGFDDWSGSPRNLGADGGVGYYEWEEAFPGGFAWRTQYATEKVCADAAWDIAAGVEFVSVWLNAPHQPFDVPPPGTYTTGDTSSELGISIAMLEAVDYYLGPVIDQALAAGHVVIVASDNGSSEHIGGGKDTLTEAGLRVPLIVAGGVKADGSPAVLQGVSYDLVQGTDLYSTIAELRGSSATTPDSLSFVPVLFQGPGMGLRRFSRSQAFKPSGLPPQAGKWSRAARSSRWKLIEDEDGTRHLYDLRRDPTESFDLVNPGPLTSEQARALAVLVGELPS